MTLSVRPARREDAAIILGFVKELAAFEREPDAVKATEADLIRDGWGAERRFEAVIAELEGAPCGFALFFHNYSTWEGRAGLYIEDLYVAERARRHGAGRALVAEVARIAVARGCGRLELAVLDWNPARGFYEKLGLTRMTEWLPYRASGAALRLLAG
jgi:GNAT superfamily N-acetyltransferase